MVRGFQAASKRMRNSWTFIMGLEFQMGQIWRRGSERETVWRAYSTVSASNRNTAASLKRFPKWKRKSSFRRIFSNEWIKFDIHQTFFFSPSSLVHEKLFSFLSPKAKVDGERSEKGKKSSLWCLLNSKTDAFALNIKNDKMIYPFMLLIHQMPSISFEIEGLFGPTERQTYVVCQTFLHKLMFFPSSENNHWRHIFVFLLFPQVSPKGRTQKINCVSHDFLITFTTHPRTHVVCNYVYLFKLLLRRKFS